MGDGIGNGDATGGLTLPGPIITGPAGIGATGPTWPGPITVGPGGTAIGSPGGW
jgi:hypothetical protein